ncbi:MAG: sodium:calcium antiporter [bacterium]
MVFQILAFIVSCVVLSLLSKSLVKTLVQIAKYLGWREFVVGFFVMAFATSLSNLFVDVSAALQGFPQLAFGDVVGGNLADLTLVMAIAVIFSKKGIPTKSKMVQTSAFFTAIIAVLPLFLILDGDLDRADGVILIASFFVYVIWLFSKGENFEKVYKTNTKDKNAMDAFWFLKNFAKLILLVILLLGASYVVVDTAQFFASSLGVSLALVGILIVGLGNCFPEAYFSIISARKGKGWMILGDLMGSVIVSATLVLGIVALITPFRIDDFSPFLIARAFTLIAVVLYLFIIRTGKTITKKEGLILLLIYILFLLAEIFMK